jgi:hypothetical protein
MLWIWNGAPGALLEYCVLGIDAVIFKLPVPNVLVVVGGCGGCGSRMSINGLQLICGSELIEMILGCSWGLATYLVES